MANLRSLFNILLGKDSSSNTLPVGICAAKGRDSSNAKNTISNFFMLICNWLGQFLSDIDSINLV